MAREFKETAHLNTDTKNFSDGMDRIKRFEELRNAIINCDNKEGKKELLDMVRDDLGASSANKMIQILKLDFFGIYIN